MRLLAFLESAESILLQYDGSSPFAAWLKNYFKQNKKFGSKDRKTIARICFAYFRTGKALTSMPMNERLLTAMVLIHPNEPQLEELIRPEWKKILHLTPYKHSYFLTNPTIIFPFAEELSPEVNEPNFWFSHLVLPDLFLRIRPGKKDIVLHKLQKAELPFAIEGECIRLVNSSKINDVLLVDEEIVVQDKSSQQVLNALHPPTLNSTFQTFTAWDCCAASGGKSILLYDRFLGVELTVSDIRESILHNLRNRFKRAGITKYQSFVADVSSKDFRSNKKYNVIICDAPCSGSGTWGRTPEQLVFFKKEKIAYYATLQRQIAVNASKALKENGAFVYITCSVFRQENEDVVAHILQNTALKLHSQEYIKGYGEKADTLFTALFFL